MSKAQQNPLIEAKINDDLLSSTIHDPALGEAHARAMLRVSVRFLASILGPREALEATYQVADAIALPPEAPRFCAQVRATK